MFASLPLLGDVDEDAIAGDLIALDLQLDADVSSLVAVRPAAPAQRFAPT